MKLANTSRYPDAEVALMVEFAMCEVDHSRVAVHVRNSSRAYRGRAYDGIPSLSARADDEEVDRLVTIGIGAPGSFPCDNLQTRVKWVRVEHALIAPVDGVFRRRRDHLGHVRTEQQVISQHGYGGKRSPVLVFQNWREALVAVAAHEGRHIWQYQHGTQRSEVDAEQQAGRRLEAFRALRWSRPGALQLPLAL